MKRIRAKTGGGFLFFLKEGMHNIFINGFMSFAAVSIIVICILIVGNFSLTALNVRTEIERQILDTQIMVFIDESYGLTEYEAISQSLQAVKHVKSIEYVSKSQALKNYKEKLGDDAYIFNVFEDDNPLPDGYIVNLETLDDIDRVTEEINLIQGIEEVSSKNDTYRALNSIQKGFDILSVILFIAFGFLSIFIISNTVKLAMFARREEISIMKMIGATDAFIRWPFVVEGLILGLISSTLAFSVTWILYNETVEFTSQFIGFITTIKFVDVRFEVLGIYLASGVIIGTFGSLFTIRKFLDV